MNDNINSSMSKNFGNLLLQKVLDSYRLITFQEETVRTPSPSTFPPPSPVANTMISVTPATPTPGPHSPVPLGPMKPGHGSGTLSPDELSCYSTHSTPINRWI